MAFPIAGRIGAVIVGLVFTVPSIEPIALADVLWVAIILFAIGAGLAGPAWSLVSSPAIPVITFEGVGPIDALKRSSSLLRQRWGPQVTGQAITGGVVSNFWCRPASPSP